MTPSLIRFIAAFLVGALAALVGRTALHRPYASMDVPPAMMAPEPLRHEGHVTEDPDTVAATIAASGTANTICPICGMPVNPDLPPAMYQGKVIGFGCRTCPAKFAADPEAYGPAALRNVEAE